MLGVAVTIVMVSLLGTNGAEFHMRALLFCLKSPPRPSSWRDWFTHDYLVWTVRGRPTESELHKRLAYHEHELIRLGAFERKEFELKHQQPSERTYVEISAFIVSLGPDAKWLAHTDFRHPRFSISATPANMRVFETAIRDYDREAVEQR